MSRSVDPHATPFVPVTEKDLEATTFACPLCAARFSHGLLVCGACPLHAGCDIVKCPQCGYQFPRSSKLVDLVRRLWRRRGAGRD